MEILYFLSALCLFVFMLLATYDGFYLHIFKYELFNHQESFFEHKMHAVRAALFPIIVWLLFIENGTISFWAGILVVAIDLIVLGVDAYSEKESRTFMGGLPKWEYILHLFANSLHFAAIMLILATKIRIDNKNIMLIDSTNQTFGAELINFVAVNIIPGAFFLALIHVVLFFPFGKNIWNNLRRKIVCC